MNPADVPSAGEDTGAAAGKKTAGAEEKFAVVVKERAETTAGAAGAAGTKGDVMNGNLTAGP